VILLAAAPAWALDPAFTCGASGDDLIVGLPGLEVPCVLEPPDDGSTWETTRWSFGDGTVVEGEAVSHVYDEAGQYTIAVELDGWEPADGTTADSERDPYTAKYGLVTVCGPPQPAFSLVATGGLDYQVVNESTVAVYCLSDLQWDVYEGAAGDGAEPVLSFDTWEPRVTLPHAGMWEFVLTMGGIAGTEAASAPIDAHYRLPEGLHVPLAEGCATPAGVPASMAIVLASALVARRRRPTC
jgi:PKD domain